MKLLIPAAGRGSRFNHKKYELPKPLIKIYDKPMIYWAIKSLKLKCDIIIILNNKQDKYQEIYDVTKFYFPNSEIITISDFTDGPASTCLFAEKYIKNDEELIIANCDQFLYWDSEDFLKRLKNKPNDGIVVTYFTDVPHNSYAAVKNGLVTQIKEKQVISKYSLNGIHYWRKAKFFYDSAKIMMTKNLRVNNEFYIAPTYQELINLNYQIGIYNIPKDSHYSLGNPNDLNNFTKKININMIKNYFNENI
jgi:dTDP-glucose pyrophosphorylase